MKLRKVICLLCCLTLLGASALAEGAVTLSGEAIVDGSAVYYAGSIDSAQEGVYRMNADGSGVSRLSDSFMTLLTADGGNLLAISYGESDYEYAVVVLSALGEKTVVYDGYVSSAIAADGRFYWGVGSCAADGSDVKLLINDPAHSYNYYPLTVEGGWYYYLDWAENSNAFFEGDPYPTAARLCRMNLATGSVDTISGYGTRFLGLDGSYIYYSRNNYWLYDEEDTDTYVAQINSGVFRADLSTLATDQLLAFPDNDRIYVGYEFLADGVLYGTLSDYSGENEINQIVRLSVDGTQLPSLSLDNQSLTLHGVQDGVMYASVCNIDFSDDDYIQHDLLYALNLADNTFILINTPASDLFYYSETPPAIRVANGRIYMLVFDNNAYAISFKSCALDGSSPITLARGYSMADG
ncbi:MAG: DUF5050 domain-containing protein [Clostridia bacterium]|nr:DUF5050 domain-containing protein [Clostridia bacterium]